MGDTSATNPPSLNVADVFAPLKPLLDDPRTHELTAALSSLGTRIMEVLVADPEIARRFARAKEAASVLWWEVALPKIPTLGTKMFQ